MRQGLGYSAFPARGARHAHAKHIYHAYAAYGPWRVEPANSCQPLPLPAKLLPPLGLAVEHLCLPCHASLALSLRRRRIANFRNSTRLQMRPVQTNGPANPSTSRSPCSVHYTLPTTLSHSPPGPTQQPLPAPYPAPLAECKFQMQLFIIAAGGTITLFCTVPTSRSTCWLTWL